MICLECHRFIKKQKTFSNLFLDEYHHICENCYQKRPLLPNYQVIPINNYVIEHHSLLIKGKRVNPNAYMSFLNPYFKYFIKNKQKDYLFLYFDSLTEKLVLFLDLLQLGNLFIVTLT